MSRPMSGPRETDPAFEAEVAAMLHRRAGDVADEASTALPDGAHPELSDAVPIGWRSGRARAALLAAACVLLLVGVGVVVAGGDGERESVVADRPGPSTPAEPTEPEGPGRDGATARAGEEAPGEEPDPSRVDGDPAAPDDAEGAASEPGAGGPGAGGPGGSGGAAGPGGPPVAGLPVVTVTQSADVISPGRGALRDCDGQVHPPETVGITRFERTGPRGAPLTVSVGAGGSLAGAVVGLPSTVTFSPGSDLAFVDYRVDSPDAGDLVISAAPGPGYQVGSPSSVTYPLAAVTITTDCLRPVAVHPSGGPADQAIDVGQRPQDLVVVRSGTADPKVHGALPPGLGLEPVYPALTHPQGGLTLRWTGAATAPGTYTFPLRYCHGEVCDGTTTITIVVRSP